MNQPSQIFACPPVDQDKQKEIGIVGLAPAPGSSQAICGRCFADVWIGPKQKGALEQIPQGIIRCFKCAVLETGGKAPVKMLGGTGADYLVDWSRVKPLPPRG